MLLPELADPRAVKRIAAILVETLAVPIPFGEHELLVSVSIGVCSALEGELDADTLLKSADAALYHAKDTGRNGFQVFTPAMDRASIQNHAAQTNAGPATVLAKYD